MTRLALLTDLSGVPKPVLDPIMDRRGGRLLKIDRLLLHSPSFAAGWNALLRAVIGELSVSPKLAQLIMTVVAMLNRCDYEILAHGAAFLSAGGTEEQLNALQDIPAASLNAELFEPKERAAMRLASEMTRDAVVTDETFEDVRSLSDDDAQLLDIVAVAAAYNMVTRFVATFQLTVDRDGL